MNDDAVAAELAAGAMHRLLELRSRFAADGADPAGWGVPADQAANAWLLDQLAALRPDDAVLSEEAPDTTTRLERSRVWIIDPLDGTREFAEPGRQDWAVHVALSIDGEPRVGAVALPDGTVLHTGAPPSPTERSTDRLRMVVSRSRPPELAHRVAAALDAEVLLWGSAGAKVAAVIRGDAELYVHGGGMRQWDSCAPIAVALAGGFHASRLDGSPLRYNGADVNLPDLVVCRPELTAAVLQAISAASG